MSETALTVQSPHLMPAMSIQEATSRYRNLVSYVKELMTDGVDYGAVPGTNKPTLLKPGAEKLTTFFGLTPRFPIRKETEDWTGSQNGGEPFFYYWFKCELWRGDTLVAEGDGSCNSRESKYRWRWVSEEDIPPGLPEAELKTRKGTLSEFTFAVDKAETSGKYGKPPEYWQQFKDAIANGTAQKGNRATRSGKSYDTWEIDATVYRVPNEDIYSQVNTIQKMAEKRALVAATLLAVNASEFFTQDVEDLDIIDAQYTVSTPATAEQRQPAPQATNGKCLVCHVTGDSHAPWCQEKDGERVDTREGNGPNYDSVPGQDADPQPQTNGRRSKGATVKTKAWAGASVKLAQAVPYYQSANGAPNGYHMVGAAKKAGYPEITDANLEDVIAALTDYAQAQQALDAEEDGQAQQAEMEIT